MWPHGAASFPKENVMTSCRRNVAFVLAIGTVALAFPPHAFAGPAKVDTMKLDAKPAKERVPKDKITTTCVPGTADYDPDQCYKDIKDDK
jgi:hypothetical protein